MLTAVTTCRSSRCHCASLKGAATTCLSVFASAAGLVQCLHRPVGAGVAGGGPPDQAPHGGRVLGEGKRGLLGWEGLLLNRRLGSVPGVLPMLTPCCHRTLLQGAHQRYFRQQVRSDQRWGSSTMGGGWAFPSPLHHPASSRRPPQLMAAKVPTLVDVAKQALARGHCVVVGLQSTGEAVTAQMVRLATDGKGRGWAAGRGARSDQCASALPLFHDPL